MSECERANSASAYHDGEMSPEARADFERHLAQCSQCQDEMAGLRKLTRFIGSSPRPQMPAGAMARLHKSVDRLPGAGVIRFAEALAAVAASVLVVCMIGLAWHPVSRDAGGTAAAAWESAAMAQQPADTSAVNSEDQTANWIVQDLSGKGEHD